MTKPLSTFLKSLLVCATLAAATWAFALPTPKDIEAAVTQGHLTQAESMLREVIAAKPQSAKAHYELAQVLLRDNRAPEARTELLQAKNIDPSLKFASSDKQFNDVMARAQAPQPAQAKPTPPAAAAATSPSPNSSSFSMTYVWMGIAALGVIALMIRMNRPAVQTPNPAYSPSSSPLPSGGPMSTAFGRQPVGAYPAGTGGYPPSAYPPAAPSGGSTMTGAVVGGLAGVAAGYALSKALEGDHHTPPAANPASNNAWSDNQGLVSGPAAPEFDAGAGSDWGDDAGGGSDDSW